MNARLLGTPVLCALFVLLWSSGFIGAKFGLDYSGTFTLLFWRYLLVVLVLGVLVTACGAWVPISGARLGRHALVGALAHAGWLAAVLGAIDLGLSAGIAAFITALQPLMTGALSSRFTGERVAGREWFGLVLGLVAVALVIGGGVSLQGSWIGYLLPLLAVVFISVASLIDRRAEVGARGGAAVRDPLLLVTFIHCAASLAVIAPLAVFIEGLTANVSPGFVFSVVWLALVVSLAAYGLMFALLRRLPAARVASLTYLSPPVTMVLAWLLFGERLAATDVAGLGLAGVAVWATLSAGATGGRLAGKEGSCGADRRDRASHPWNSSSTAMLQPGTASPAGAISPRPNVTGVVGESARYERTVRTGSRRSTSQTVRVPAAK